MADSTKPNGNDKLFYVLRYKKGNVMGEMHYRETDLSEAISKGKQYCAKNALQFINVYDWEKDIDKMIAFKPGEAPQ